MREFFPFYALFPFFLLFHFSSERLKYLSSSWIIVAAEREEVRRGALLIVLVIDLIGSVRMVMIQTATIIIPLHTTEDVVATT